ncbi:MAG: FGLLP motif-containing membrane protein, partial [Pseudonocardiaceae bacterium]
DGHLDRAYLTTQVASPFQVFNVFDHPLQLLLSVLLVVLLVLVVAFPADLFNSTFENNREEINNWFRWIPRPPRLNLPSWVHLDIFGLVAAVLLLMAVVPDIGLDEATLAQAVGFLLAVPLVVVILEVSGGFYSRWKRRNSAWPEQLKQREPQWNVLPSALIVAGFLALLSRLAHFSPPYVYGLIAVYIGGAQALKNLNEVEEREEKGRRTVTGMLCLFAASVIAWFSWIPLDHAFDRGLQGFGWLIADAFLVTFFLLGLETAVFGMIPLTFLKGKEVWRWKRAIWVAIFLPIAYVFVNVQFVVREATDLTLTGKIMAVVLFFAFGLFSVAFWGYFHPGVRRRFSRLVRR